MVGKQEGKGIEMEVLYQGARNLLLSVDYAYRWTKDDKTQKGVVEVPIHIGHLRASWEAMAKTIFIWESQFVADIPRAEGDTRDKVGDYTLSHITLKHDYKDFSGKLSIRNLFDRTYEQPTTNTVLSDYSGSGRMLSAQVSYRF